MNNLSTLSNNFKINCFSNYGLKISLASPETIIKWSLRQLNGLTFIGEVTEPLTINFKGGVPESNGLFCEKIFGPLNSWACQCGGYKKNNLTFFCGFCGGEFNDSRIRRYRLGFIFLKSPFIHPWYFKGPSSVLSCVLEQSQDNLERMIYYTEFLVAYTNLIKFNSKDNFFPTNFNLTKINFSQLLFISNLLQDLLFKFNILTELSFCRERLLHQNSLSEKKFLTKKINLLHIFFIGNLNLGWLFLDVLPVIPPGLRPFFKLKEGFFLTSPINDIYRTILMKNNRLQRWIKLRPLISPLFEITEKRNIQKILDTLFYKADSKKNFSLIEVFKGKYGRFRQNLLGKRIDFSGRSVIISGPDMVFNKIGIPFELALNLFKPILLKYVRDHYTNQNLLKAILFLQQNSISLKKFLTEILKTQIILVNRAPTLHRMNIQAFKPYLIEGEAIKFFPLACSSFNADFDGDQVGIFVSLSKQAKIESKTKLSFDKNVFSPLTGKNLFKPTQNIILGLYVLLNLNPKTLRGSFLYYSNPFDVLAAYEHNVVDLQALIWLKCSRIKRSFEMYQKLNSFFVTSVGRVILTKNMNIN